MPKFISLYDALPSGDGVLARLTPMRNEALIVLISDETHERTEVPDTVILTDSTTIVTARSTKLLIACKE